MSRVFANKIDDEHISLDFDHEFCGVLRARDLAPEIAQLWSVGTIERGGDNSNYILAVVTHLNKPLDEIDVVASERTETLVCGCDGWYYHYYDQQVGAKTGDCKHCERVKQKRRETVDDQQTTL